MATASLTSNHVNYLVWRYLQESGFGDSAVKLQRDWTEHPQGLPFAQYVKTHALVQLVQKGLQYHEIEQRLDQTGRLARPSEGFYFFGPADTNGREIAFQPPNADGDRDEDVASAGHPASPRKYSKESTTNHATNTTTATSTAHPSQHHRRFSFSSSSQPAAKRPRRSNGVENGEDAMDVDAPEVNGHVHGPANHLAADASANANSVVAGPPEDHRTKSEPPTVSMPDVPPTAAPTRPMTNGSSVATQVEKIAELEPETTVLDLSGNRSASVMMCSWNPVDPACLATAGTSALSRIWNLSLTRPIRSRSPTNVDDKDWNPTPYVDLKEEDRASWMVTALAWSPDGSYLAIGASDADRIYDGRVTVWSKNGALVNVVPTGLDAILCLRWNSVGSVLLGICGGLQTSKIMLWDPHTADPLDCIPLEAPLEDACWVHDNSFIVAGGRVLHVYRIDGGTHLTQSYNVPDDRELWLVRYDPITTTVATCTHGNIVDIWDHHTLLHSLAAHNDHITALEWQPLPNPRSQAHLSDSEPRLLATSSLDGTVRLCNGKAPFQLLHALSLGLADLPVMNLAFSPDGFALAASSSSRILVWNAQEGGPPKASWDGKMFGVGEERDRGGVTARNGDIRSPSSVDEDAAQQQSLAWDADGRKLVHGLHRQIAVINFRR
ncbi:MAG: hypothetical protein M1817_002647 [Caeruleum heppii]|nr:MAG: hypothetical protein M1817_002647 [Caeruleum heppii]